MSLASASDQLGLAPPPPVTAISYVQLNAALRQSAQPIFFFVLQLTAYHPGASGLFFMPLLGASLSTVMHIHTEVLSTDCFGGTT